jgi:hypothetical protein
MSFWTVFMLMLVASRFWSAIMAPLLVRMEFDIG